MLDCIYYRSAAEEPRKALEEPRKARDLELELPQQTAEPQKAADGGATSALPKSKILSSSDRHFQQLLLQERSERVSEVERLDGLMRDVTPVKQDVDLIWKALHDLQRRMGRLQDSVSSALAASSTPAPLPSAPPSAAPQADWSATDLTPPSLQLEKTWAELDVWQRRSQQRLEELERLVRAGKGRGEAFSESAESPSLPAPGALVLQPGIVMDISKAWDALCKQVGTIERAVKREGGDIADCHLAQSVDDMPRVEVKDKKIEKRRLLADIEQQEKPVSSSSSELINSKSFADALATVVLPRESIF